MLHHVLSSIWTCSLRLTGFVQECVCVCVCVFRDPVSSQTWLTAAEVYTIDTHSIKTSLMLSQTITELSRNCPYVVINGSSYCCFIWILIFNLVYGRQGYAIHKRLMDVPQMIQRTHVMYLLIICSFLKLILGEASCIVFQDF